MTKRSDVFVVFYLHSDSFSVNWAWWLFISFGKACFYLALNLIFRNFAKYKPNPVINDT